jgi:hypothetical protein
LRLIDLPVSVLKTAHPVSKIAAQHNFRAQQLAPNISICPKIVSNVSVANPTIVSYNASAVKTYNAMAVKTHNASAEKNLQHQRCKNPQRQRSNNLQRWRCSCKFYRR